MISKKKRKLREKMYTSKMKRDLMLKEKYLKSPNTSEDAVVNDVFDWAEYLRCAGNRDNDFMVIPEGSKII